jgi:hypothetical protein
VSALKKVWAPFLIAAFVVGVVIWRVLNHHYKGRLETKDDLIRLKDGQLQDYKDKLSGATPDEAKEQIAALRKEIEALEPKQRTLTPDQKKALTEFAATKQFVGSHAEIIYVPSVHETVVFATEIAAALQEGGWPVRADFALGGGLRPTRGLSLAVHNMEKRSAMAMMLGLALERAGLPFKWEQQEGVQASARLYVDLAE